MSSVLYYKVNINSAIVVSPVFFMWPNTCSWLFGGTSYINGNMSFVLYYKVNINSAIVVSPVFSMWPIHGYLVALHI